MALSDVTLLRLQNAEDNTDIITEYSARGLKQTLNPISTEAPKRTVNGTLVDVSPPQFRKFATKISCTDVDGPGISGVWIGKEVIVTCLTDIAGGGEDSTALVFHALVVNWTVDRDEAGFQSSWSIDLEQI